VRRQLLVLVFIALLVAMPAARAEPAPFASADAPGVRPGAFLRVDGGFCTLGFLLVDGTRNPRKQHRYMTTAGHCALPDPKPDTTWAPGTGPEAVVDGERIGEVVYAVQDAQRDIALIRLDRGVAASPSVLHWGGPTALYTDHEPDPVVLRHVGNGVFVGALWNAAFAGVGERDVRLVSARTALAADTLSEHEVLAMGAASVGDSGSPVLDDEGRAVGVLVNVARTGTDTGPVAFGTMQLGRLDFQLGPAEKVLGVRLSLVTAPLA
jgi:hypothetical protein